MNNGTLLYEPAKGCNIFKAIKEACYVSTIACVYLHVKFNCVKFEVTPNDDEESAYNKYKKALESM